MVAKKASVLVVDDEPVICDLLKDEMNDRNYLCTTALNGRLLARKLHSILNRMHKEQRGSALLLVLIMLLVGGLIIAPLLAFMGTGLKTGLVFEEKTEQLYAADGGVEYAIWEITYNDFVSLADPSSYNEYDYSTTWNHSLTEEVNEESVDFTIDNVWVPSNISMPNPTQAEGIIDTGTLVVLGSASGSSCRIRLDWYSEEGEELKVNNIGIWLPSGFSYVSGSSNLEDDPFAPYYPSSINTSSHLGGQAIVFNFSPALPFPDLPNVIGSSPFTTVIEFDYTTPTDKQPTFVSWINTTGVPGISFSWDNNSKVYHITSLADNTTIESVVVLPPGSNLTIYDGALVAGQDIDLGKDSTVSGDIIYGDSFTYKSGFQHIDGEEINEDPQFPTQEENEDFAETYKQEAMDTWQYPGTYSIGQGNGVDPVYLGPIYISGNLCVDKDNILVITGPIYVEGDIDVDKDAEFTGSGGIIAVGDIYLAKTNDFGTDGNSIIMSLNGNMTFKKEATLEAVIYAPNGNLQFDKSATITGSVIAGESTQADKDGTYTQIPGSHDFFELPGYTSGALKTLTWEIE